MANKKAIRIEDETGFYWCNLFWHFLASMERNQVSLFSLISSLSFCYRFLPYCNAKATSRTGFCFYLCIVLIFSSYNSSYTIKIISEACLHPALGAVTLNYDLLPVDERRPLNNFRNNKVPNVWFLFWSCAHTRKPQPNHLFYCSVLCNFNDFALVKVKINFDLMMS